MVRLSLQQPAQSACAWPKQAEYYRVVSPRYTAPANRNAATPIGKKVRDRNRITISTFIAYSDSSIPLHRCFTTTVRIKFVLARKLRIRLLQIIVILAGLSIVAGIFADLWLSVIGRWINIPTTHSFAQADVIIIHGGNPFRTQYGIELYQRGLAPQLWHLGYAFTEGEITASVEPAVPAQAFTFLPSTSTWTDGTQIARMIREHQIHNVIIVTDWWHSRRALCSTEEQLQGYNVSISFSSSPSPAGPNNWWHNEEVRKDVLNELVKMVYYSFRYGWKPWDC